MSSTRTRPDILIDFSKIIDRDRMNYYIINNTINIIERDHAFHSNIDISRSGWNLKKCPRQNLRYIPVLIHPFGFRQKK